MSELTPIDYTAMALLGLVLWGIGRWFAYYFPRRDKAADDLTREIMGRLERLEDKQAENQEAMQERFHRNQEAMQDRFVQALKDVLSELQRRDEMHSKNYTALARALDRLAEKIEQIEER